MTGAPPTTLGDSASRRTAVRRVLSNTGWLIGARAFGDTVNLILVVVLARRFGPAGYGQYAYGFVVATFVYYLLSLGLEQFAVRECSRLAAEERKRLIGSLVALQLAVAVVVSIGLGGFLWLTHATVGTSAIILMLSVYQGSAALAWTLFVPSLAEQQMATAALAEPVCRLLSMVGAIVLVAAFSAPLVGALALFPIGGLAMLGLGTWSARRHIGPFAIKITWEQARRDARVLWPFAGADVLYQVWARTDLLLVTQFLGVPAAGIYASALKLVETATVPLPLVGSAAYPLLSRSAPAGRRGLPKGSDRLLAGMLALGFAITWGLWFLAPAVLVPLLGVRFAAAVPLLKYLAPVGLIMALEHTVGRLLLTANMQTTRFQLLAISAACKVVLATALIPVLGLAGAAVAWITAWVVSVSLSLGALARRCDISLLARSGLLLLGPIAASTLVGAAAFLLRWGPALAATASLAVFAALLLCSEFVRLVAGRPLGALVASLRRAR